MRMKPNFACLYGYKYQSCGEHNAASIRNKILPQTIFRQWHPLTLFFDQLFLWRGKIDKKYILNWSGAFPLCSRKRDLTLKEKKRKKMINYNGAISFFHGLISCSLHFPCLCSVQGRNWKWAYYFVQ